MRYPQEIQDVINRMTEKEFPRIECDSGWYGIIGDLNRELSSIDPDYTVFQVKEKFGVLRYYFRASKEELQRKMAAVVDHYTYISSTVCEISGKEGACMHVKDYWLKTVHPDNAPDGYVVFPDRTQYEGNDREN